MAKFITKYNEFGQAFLAMPVTLNYTGEASIIVKQVYIENIFAENNPTNSQEYVFEIETSSEDYSDVTPGDLTDFEVPNYSTSYSDVLNRNFKVGREFTMNSNNSFTFNVLFQPNTGNNSIRFGDFNGTLKVFCQVVSSVTQAVSISYLATSTLKEITTVDGISYDSILNIMQIDKSNISIFG